MTSQRLRAIFVVTVVLLGLHMVEEYLMSVTFQPHVFDVVTRHFTDPIRGMLLIYFVLLFYVLIMFSLYVIGGKWQLRALTLFALVYLLELQHVVVALMHGMYEPGLVTALLFPVIGVVYVKELVQCHSRA